METYHNLERFPSQYLTIFYIIVAIFLLILLFRFRKSQEAIVIILLFFSGLAGYLGKSIENPYKIAMLVLSFYIVIKNKAYRFQDEKTRRLIFLFSLFTASFLSSAFINHNKLTLIFSQYAKFLVPILFFLVFNKYSKKSTWRLQLLNKLFYSLLIVQIIITAVKFLIFGNLETIVGSISYIGGALATVLPIFGFIYIWTIRDGALKKTDWLLIIGLIFIGFVSNKRAIWFIMPIVIFLFIYYIPSRRIPKSYYLLSPLIPLLFYVGVRLNSTLNPENKKWGSFNFDYVMDYALFYQFGIEEEGKEVNLGSGRGGATFLLFNKIFNEGAAYENNLFGFGFDEFYTKNYQDFDQFKYGIRNKGSASGVYQGYITTGFIGLLSFLLYAFSLILLIKQKRLRLVIMLIFIWEYFFYTGILFRIQPLTILLVYIISYSNYKYMTNSNSASLHVNTSKESN